MKSEFRQRQTGKEEETQAVSESVGGAADPQVQRELPKGDSCWSGFVSPSVLAEGSSSLEKNSSSSLGELGSFLSKCFDKVMRCKSSYSAQGEVVDPLFSSPSACISSGSCPYEGWLSATCRALRDLADEPHGKKEGWQLESVREQLRRFDVWDVKGPVVNFEEFFNSKSVDYGGEEVRLAQSVNWEAVKNSLPSSVGELPVEEFCSLGTRHYIQNFENYLIPPKDQIYTKPPKVLIEGGQWHAVCEGLIERGVCEVMAVADLYHVGNEPLLNGLFAVGKGEYIGTLETQRLIMNLVPTNRICRSIKGDVGTLPAVAGMGGVLLEGEELLLISSEDIRCFFYLFKIPHSWRRYMGFNKLVPDGLVPASLKGQECVLVSCVLPMGFCNSVAIAQHIHRGVVSKVSQEGSQAFPNHSELRRDKPLPTSSVLHRIYLDNFDALECVDQATAALIAGTPSAEVLSLRHQYETLGLPRHPKKAVERACRAEVQGALVLGDVGIVIPKPQKLWQYLHLGLELLSRGSVKLKELQVVTGGLVYFAMFRRPLLSALNQVWRFMESLKGYPPVVRMPLPLKVRQEIFRALCLVPLAQMNFRAAICGRVSCSDASQSGGGICVSKGLTAFGAAASRASVRGDLPEREDSCEVLSVGLFDGLGALRVACDVLQLPMAGHISVEKEEEGRRIVESYFPDTLFHDDVTTVTLEMVRQWACLYQNVGVVIIGAGPPCQGVSGLNADKRGALKDHRSCLFQQVPPIVLMFRQCFPWAQVHFLGESVASMSEEDRGIMSAAFEDVPWQADCFGLTLCHRPRLYWVTWDLESSEGIELCSVEGRHLKGSISFKGEIHREKFLEGKGRLAGQDLPTFTTPRPRLWPGRRPAGLHSCASHEVSDGAQTNTATPLINTKMTRASWTLRGGDCPRSMRKKRY